MSYRQLAEKHRVGESVCEKRGVMGKWTVLRREATAKVAREISARLREERINQLEEWNKSDIALARGLRAQVARHITLMANKPDGTVGEISCEKLRSLAMTAEAAQRIGRLALGASSENVDQPIVPGMAPTLNDFLDMVEIMGPNSLADLDAGATPTH